MMSWYGCQWRWMLDFLCEKRSETYSVHLTFGNVLHFYLDKIKNPDPDVENMSIDEAIVEFEQKFREKYGEIRELDKNYLEDHEIDWYVAAGQNIIKNIDSCKELIEAKVLFTEYKLFEDISRSDGVEIKFKGYIDLVIMTKDKRGKKVLYICDYKTCSWGWNVEKKNNEDLKIQLRLYKHFFSKKFNIDPKQIRTAFVLLKKKPRDKDKPVEWLPFSSGNKTTMRAVDKMNAAITGMQTNDYKKNRNMCINEYGDKCPYYGTTDCVDD